MGPGNRRPSVRGRAAAILPWLAPLLAFFLPLSTSGITVLALLILAAWLVEGDLAAKADRIIAHPVCLALLVLFGLMALGLLWSPDPLAGLAVIRENWKIALLPLLMTTTREISPRRVVLAYLAGLAAAVLLTFLVWLDLVHYADVSPVHLTKGTFHVVYNPLLALGIYLALHEALWGGYPVRGRIGLLLLAGIMSVNMFMTEGRTGQLVFFVLMGLFLVQVLERSRRQAALAVLLLLPLVFAGGYHFSPVFRARIQAACREVACFHDNPQTSVGFRLLFWQNSWQIIRQHPLLGVGTGGFVDAYARINREHSPDVRPTDNPHNQYVLILVMLGLPGLLALLAIFGLMMREAGRVAPRWRRAAFAFPVFFLVIMLTESYLKVYETGFLFALFGGVLYVRRPDPRLIRLRTGEHRCWLILSYRANVPGSACSQHLDDRLVHFRDRGVEPVLLTGPVGERSDEWIHFRTFSLAPSGIRFEVRHFLRKHLEKRWQFKVAETLILLPVFPLYLLEKVIINLESEWSWWIMASLRGILLCRSLGPTVVYSTGGSASAHLAALVIRRFCRVRWLAETQDPLVHDHDWQRSRVVLHLYRGLERRICRRADAFVFLVAAARRHAELRTNGHCRARVIYPGADPGLLPPVSYRKGTYCRFAHFGSLAGTRNLVVFFQGLSRCLEQEPGLSRIVRVDVYGSFDGRSARVMDDLGLASLVEVHGPVPREEALGLMQMTDVLLLIQNIIFFSCETIPSKVYEYILTGRPILGLVHNNPELERLLADDRHQVAAADDPGRVAGAIREMVRRFEESDFASRPPENPLTVAGAVERLMELVGE